MSRNRIYLDYNASAPVRPEARAAFVQRLDSPGNASSVHQEGRDARHAVECAREAVGRSLGLSSKTVTFVSGGTEANVTALNPLWKINGQDLVFERLFVSAVEHPSVLAGGRFLPEQVEILPVGSNGQIDLEALESRLSGREAPVLISVMAANNETGIVQPIQAISELVHSHGSYLHTDAVQAFGKMPIDVNELGADAVTVSAHKIGGLQGVGVIATRDDVAIPALMRGGGQEDYRRAGTENVAAIAAFGATISMFERIESEWAEIRRLRDLFEAELNRIAPYGVVFGQGEQRLGNTTCFAIPGIRAETAMINFDLGGIAVSSGSACSSGKVSASHVLKAMGVEDAVARGAVRVSLGWATTPDDISSFLQAVRAVCKNQRPQGQTKAA